MTHFFINICALLTNCNLRCQICNFYCKSVIPVDEFLVKCSIDFSYSSDYNETHESVPPGDLCPFSICKGPDRRYAFTLISFLTHYISI